MQFSRKITSARSRCVHRMTAVTTRRACKNKKKLTHQPAHQAFILRKRLPARPYPDTPPRTRAPAPAAPSPAPSTPRRRPRATRSAATRAPACERRCRVPTCRGSEGRRRRQERENLARASSRRCVRSRRAAAVCAVPSSSMTCAPIDSGSRLAASRACSSASRARSEHSTVK